MPNPSIPIRDVEKLLKIIEKEFATPGITEGDFLTALRIVRECLEESKTVKYLEASHVKELMAPYIIGRGEDFRRAIWSRIDRDAKTLGELSG